VDRIKNIIGKKWYRYIDHVISLIKVDDFVKYIYVIALEIKHSTDRAKSTSYLDPRLDIDSEGPLRTVIYDKRDNFNVSIVNFLLI
jgi:hypothetical protein